MNFKRGFLKKVMLCFSLATALMLSGCNKKEESYRIISAHEVEGVSNVTREKIGTMDVYQGMNFQSGDNVEVTAESMLRLALDDDKFLTLEENTKMKLTADGDENSERTVIELEEGAVTATLNKKLNSESSFEVNTPKATMSVRGTTFRVVVEGINEGKQAQTIIQLFEGELEIQLLDENNDPYGEPVILTSGNEAIIITDITGDSGQDNVSFFKVKSQPIDYSTIPDIVREHIIEYYDNGNTALAEAVAAFTGNTVSETVSDQLLTSEITSSETENESDESASVTASDTDSSTESGTYPEESSGSDDAADVTSLTSSDRIDFETSAVTTAVDDEEETGRETTVTVQSEEESVTTTVTYEEEEVIGTTASSLTDNTDEETEEETTVSTSVTEKSTVTTTASGTFTYKNDVVITTTAETTTASDSETTTVTEVVTKPHVTFNYNGGELIYDPEYDPDK